jgi:2'-5' RNA ligase
MSLLRTFIAADIPPPIKQSIQQQVDNLRTIFGTSPVRWVPVNNIHLTLKFLGDVSPARVDLLTRILHAEANSQPAFGIQINGLGSFPNAKRARILLMEIQAPAGLAALQLAIESACAGVGFDSQARPFAPHLTIGRVRKGISASGQQKIYEILRDVKIDSLGTARVDCVHLYKSELKPSGAVYTKLFSAPLQKEVKTESTRTGT